MSKPRYDWWPYVKGMIRRYPYLRREKDDLQQQSTTANVSGMPRGSGISNPTQTAALRRLSRTAERELRAVELAIEDTGRRRDGKERLQLIERVFWRRTHTLEGAAQAVPCSLRTARRWHSEFIRLVAKNYGLFD